MNKNTRITPVTPPAGFTTETETTPRGEEFFYCAGPKATSGQITVESFWDQPGGISFHITNGRHLDNGIFNREELEAIPNLVRNVLEQIDIAHAVEYMKANPVPKRFPRWHTVTDIAAWCDEHNIGAVAGFAAFDELHGAEYRINGGADDA